MNECTIRMLSPMECVLMTACESERGNMVQIRIGTVLAEDKKGPRLTIQFWDIKEIEVRSLEHALFQARMWREYAQTYDGRKASCGAGEEWVRKVLRMSRRQCLARARAWVIAAGMWNQARKTGFDSATRPE